MTWNLADDLEYEALCLTTRMLLSGCMIADAEAVAAETEHLCKVLRQVLS